MPFTVELYESDNATPVIISGRSTPEITTAIRGATSVQESDLTTDFGTIRLQVPVRCLTGGTWGMNPEAVELTPGRVVRVSIDGEQIYAGTIRPRRQESIPRKGAQGVDRPRVRELVMQGLLAEWDRAVLAPPPGTENVRGKPPRAMAWYSLEAPIETLSQPTTFTPVFNDTETFPKPWLDAFGGRFDTSSHRYLILDHELDVDRIVVTHNAAKDQFNHYWQGLPVGTGALPPETSKEKTRRGGISAKAGVNRFAYEVVGLGSESWLAASAFYADDAESGQLNRGTFLWHTGEDPDNTPDLFPWYWSNTPVGPTCGKMITVGWAEAQDRGAIPDWELDFDETNDSNGNAWDPIAEVVFDFGAKLGSGFLQRLALLGHVDLAVGLTGKVLKAYRPGERGNYFTSPASPVVFSGGDFGVIGGRNPNIVNLVHEERLP
jgi:hypothetical protein